MKDFGREFINKIKLEPGAGTGKVLTSDEFGYGTWGTGGAGGSGSSGTSGSSSTEAGPSGSSGTSGTSGSSSTVIGTSGSSGTSGIGSSGTSGTSGINGSDGLSGSHGTSGTSGSSGTSGIGSSGTSGSSGVPGTSGTSGTSSTSGVLPMGYIYGCNLLNDADTEHDIRVTAGKCRDATDTVDMVLVSAITKQADAEWAVGSNAGGFAAGESIPASATIHVWLIKRSDTGVVDVMFNNPTTSGLSPTLPENYDYKRLIGSYRTDASSNILNGNWYGTGLHRKFILDANIIDYNGDPAGTAAISYALSVPSWVQVEAIFNAYVTNASTYQALFSSLDSTDEVPSATNFNHIGAFGVPQEHRIITDTSGQIRFKSITEPTSLIIMTRGWTQFL